ncbi:MAG: hypothetical protein EAZ57_03850 [Cytophagales bacterium]|nr:MAG: hypothetical protein EAZ67_04865 [Cytophagales bacterium]TAF61345.1 MAG: hypothetical protein EAZ57_03850 [Cytophagales bacterium]
MKNILLLCIAFGAAFNMLQAQNKPEYTKGSYVDSLNRYYQQASLPLYVYFAHSPTATPQQISPSDAPNKKNELKPVYLDGHGKHVFKHFDDIHNDVQTFMVYADGLAPASEHRYLDASYHLGSNGQKYFGKSLKVRLNCKDEMSGVKELMFSLNKADFKPYQNTLDIYSEGNNTLVYFGVDMVGNVESDNVENFILDITAPSTFYNVTGVNIENNTIAASTKLYLTSQDASSGVATTYYSFDEEPLRVYRGGSLDISYLADGNHTLNYYSVDKVQNREENKSFTFYLDKTAPIVTSDVLGDKFIANDKIYFSGRTKLKLTAVDNRSGIKQTVYSIDGSGYVPYVEPFYLPSKSGIHLVRYYSLDNTDNEGAGNRYATFDEYKHTVSAVYVDLTGPSLSKQYIGASFLRGDTMFINRNTRISLLGIDAESGTQKLTYLLDSASDEADYSQPFNVAADGVHKIKYYGYDNVNNRNVSDFVFVVDNQGPEVFHHYSIKPLRVENGLEVYPQYTVLFLGGTDLFTGSKNIYYSLNGGKMQVYNGLVKGFGKNKTYQVLIRAEDMLGNISEKTIEFKTDKF